MVDIVLLIFIVPYSLKFLDHHIPNLLFQFVHVNDQFIEHFLFINEHFLDPFDIEDLDNRVFSSNDFFFID